MSDRREPEFLTVKDFVARQNGKISLSGVKQAIYREELPHVRVGKRIYIPANAFELMMERQQQAHKAALRS
jgi:hypothetical protein